MLYDDADQKAEACARSSQSAVLHCTSG